MYNRNHYLVANYGCLQRQKGPATAVYTAVIAPVTWAYRLNQWTSKDGHVDDATGANGASRFNRER